MNDELNAIADRIRQRRLTTTAAASAVIGRAAGTFSIGDTVFDAVTGLDGTVLGAGLASRLRANDVKIHLDDGRDVIRGAGELIARPAHG
jgi:hypothetical protein